MAEAAKKAAAAPPPPEDKQPDAAPSPADVAGADLRKENRVASDDAGANVIHVYRFENGYGAKVWQPKKGQSTEWSVAPIDSEGRVPRNLPGLPRVPVEAATAERVNEVLEAIAAL